MAAKEKARYIGFDGRNNLVVSDTAGTSTTGWAYVDSLDKFPHTYVKFPLKEVTVEQIKELRRSTIPSFLLKENGKYYFAKIPKNLNLISSSLIGKHQCSGAENTCVHLSAATDEEGGCAKVRNFSIEIERYPFITTGYETFNCNHNCFVALNCTHFEKSKSRKPISAKERYETRLLLAQFLWEDVETLADVNKRTQKNFDKLKSFSKQ